MIITNSNSPSCKRKAWYVVKKYQNISTWWSNSKKLFKECITIKSNRKYKIGLMEEIKNKTIKILKITLTKISIILTIY